MTRDKAKKHDIRNRMKETGESYTVAMRKLEEVSPDVVVWELGEHGGNWFVEGTQDTQEAIKALEWWLNDTDPEMLQEWPSFLDQVNLTVRDNWFWQSLNPQYPEDESVLRNLDQHKESYKNQPLMRGIFITE